MAIAAALGSAALAMPQRPHDLSHVAAAQSLTQPFPTDRAVLLKPTAPHLEIVDPVGCFKDANVNQNMCGPTARATCTGSHSPGVCCGSTGWCGSTDAHCGDGMQVEYSHSRGLCDSAVYEIAQQQEEENFDANTSKCVSMQQVANAPRLAEKVLTTRKCCLSGQPVPSQHPCCTACPDQFVILSRAGVDHCYPGKVRE